MSDKNKTSTYNEHQQELESKTTETQSQKTSLYENNHQETAAYSDLQIQESKSYTHKIGKGDLIKLKEKEFLVIEIISEGTGEATIYKIEDTDKKTFALKLYKEFVNYKEEPNYETLKRISSLNDSDILKLHDFGVGADKYLSKYCYEISDYAEGGDLFSVSDFTIKYTKEFVENRVIPEIYNGIKQLHNLKVYHCDLKPSNIFFKDKNQTDLLIGDYGSAKAYDLETEKDVRKSSTVKGTDAYLPPEQARGIISEKNDYYSFGIILLHILYPNQIVKENNVKQVDNKKLEKIIERQYNSQSIIEFNPNYKRLNNLIEGLTLINHINRFGKIEVEKWLSGEDVEVKYKSFENNLVQPIKLGFATIKTDKDFVNVLDTHEKWYDDLIEDKDTFSTVKNWMDSYKDIPSRKVFDSMIRHYQPYGKDYVKEALLRYFDPKREIKIDMISFNFFNSNDIKKNTQAYIAKLDEIWKFTSIEKIRFYLFQLEFSLKQKALTMSGENKLVLVSIIDKILSVFGLFQKSFDDYKTEIQNKISTRNITEAYNTSLFELESFRYLINLFYVFNPTRSFKDSKNNSIASIEELGLFYVKNESSYEDKFLKIEKEKFLINQNKSEINSLEYKQFIFEIFKDKAEANVELVDLTFDKHRDYQVNYKFYKSLNTYLTQNKISTDFTTRSNQNLTYKHKRKFFHSFTSEYNNFIKTVTINHNITTLTQNNLDTIKRKFILKSWKRYLYIYSGQILAFLMAIPLIVIVYGLYTKQLHIYDGFKLSWENQTDSPNIESMPTNSYQLYKLKNDANIRSEPSKKSSIIGKVFKNQEVKVLDMSNSDWYRVEVDNNIGYINSKLLYLPITNDVNQSNNTIAHKYNEVTASQIDSTQKDSTQYLNNNNGNTENIKTKNLKNVNDDNYANHSQFNVKSLVGNWKIESSSIGNDFSNQELNNKGSLYQFYETGDGVFIDNPYDYLPKKIMFSWKLSEDKLVLDFNNDIWDWQIIDGSETRMTLICYKHSVRRVIVKI